MDFCVVMYDINGMAEDPENPGHAVSYRNGNTAVPVICDSNFATFDEAKAKADEKQKDSGGETIDITLANGSHYNGPRYKFVVGQEVG